MVDVSFTMLHDFRTLAKKRTVAQAADALHITQSGLSQSVATLEKRLGKQLVTHNPQGVTLTRAGNAYYADIVDPLAAFSEACTRIFGVGPADQTINVAYAMITQHQLIEPLQQRCRSAGLRLVLHRMWTSHIPAAVEAGDIDIGFARHPQVWGQLRAETLWSSPLVATVGEHHRLAGRTEVSLKELADETLVILPRQLSPGPYDVIESACLRSGFIPKFAQLSHSGRAQWPAENHLVGIGPEFADEEVPANIRVIPIVEPFHIGLHAMTRYAEALHGPVNQVLAFARAIADERESRLSEPAALR